MKFFKINLSLCDNKIFSMMLSSVISFISMLLSCLSFSMMLPYAAASIVHSLDAFYALWYLLTSLLSITRHQNLESVCILGNRTVKS